MSLFSRIGKSHPMTWIKSHLAMLVIVGTLMDTAVFGVQGYQINVLNNQQAQLSQFSKSQAQQDEKAQCWAHILDEAVAKPHLTSADKASLTRQAKHCKTLP